MKILDSIYKTGIVPVIKLEDASKTLSLGNALLAGDINIAEITFRTKCAPNVIELLAKNMPKMIVGAGTVVNLDQAKLAIDSGAKFIVSPGFSLSVISFCVKNSIPVLPGCITPTELIMAMDQGLDVVKFFPSGEFGGLTTMKALSAPFPSIRFVPTGGVSENNLGEYIASKFIFACGGTFMVKDKLINENNYEEITRLSKLATGIVKENR